MVVYFPFIFSGGIQGIAVFPFIFVRYKYLKNDQRIINHERIHLRQQIEMVWFFFFLIYVLEYIIKLIKYKNSHKAYLEISFEREAYANDVNFNYLNNRKFWNFLKYY